MGAASAKLKNGDPLSGALGAVVGETVGETLRTELEESGITQDHPDYDRQVDRAVNIARFTAASVACGLGQDAEAASFAAGNAARFNAFAFDERIKSILKFFSPTEEDLEEGESSSSIAHKTGEKLLDHYAQLADWAIEYMEKNPDSAKALDVAMMVMGEYSQLMTELPERIITGEATRTRQAQEQLSDVQANATKEIKQYLKDAGYSREKQIVYAHALAAPVILLKTLTRTKGGAPQGISKELLKSLKEFKQSHAALKTKALKTKATPKPNAKRLAPERPTKETEFPHKDKAQRTTNTQSPSASPLSSSNIDTSSFTKPTKELIGKNHTFKEQLLERGGAPKGASTLRAAQKELKGQQIEKALERGRTYDHVKKAENAMGGLKKHIKDINNRLSYLDLPQIERQVLQNELSQSSKLLDYAKQFLKDNR